MRIARIARRSHMPGFVKYSHICKCLPVALVLMIILCVGNCFVKPMKITSVSADNIRVYLKCSDSCSLAEGTWGPHEHLGCFLLAADVCGNSCEYI